MNFFSEYEQIGGFDQITKEFLKIRYIFCVVDSPKLYQSKYIYFLKWRQVRVSQIFYNISNKNSTRNYISIKFAKGYDKITGNYLGCNKSIL